MAQLELPAIILHKLEEKLKIKILIMLQMNMFGTDDIDESGKRVAYYDLK